MFNLTIDGKRLKGLIDKVEVAMMNKVSIPQLHEIVLRADNGKLYATVTNMESWLIVMENDCIMQSQGAIILHKDDFKVVTKMTGDVRMIETEESIIVKNGKKTITLRKYEVDDYPQRIQEASEKKMTCTESDLLETLTNLSMFCGSGNNVMLNAININFTYHRWESTDGHRIAMKKIAEDCVLCHDGNLALHGRVVKDLKKTLDKKSSDLVEVYDGNTYISIIGNDFEYYVRKLKGDYYNIQQFLAGDYTCSFNANTMKALDHFKYYAENVIDKESKNPVVIRIEDDKLITYGYNMRFETSDEMEISNFHGKGFTIGFNPRFLVDAFKIADAETFTIKGKNTKSPILLEAIDYSFLMLPVYLKESGIRMEQYLEKIKVAQRA